jgi:hypothetical protein
MSVGETNFREEKIVFHKTVTEQVNSFENLWFNTGTYKMNIDLEQSIRKITVKLRLHHLSKPDLQYGLGIENQS